jgi:hypothetical protein
VEEGGGRASTGGFERNGRTADDGFCGRLQAEGRRRTRF